jgi:superfamily II RNA helicase
MAGRAGRRGKDDNGYSIIYLDTTMDREPTIEQCEELFANKGQPLESKLKVSYKMILSI